MRKYGIPEPYERLKELTRGASLDRDRIRELIDQLGLPDEARRQVLALAPHNYIGAAEALVEKLLGK